MIKQDAGHIVYTDEIREIEDFAHRDPKANYTAFEVFSEKRLTNEDAEEGSYVIKSTLGGATVLHHNAEYPKIKVNGSKVLYSIEDVGVGFGIKKTDIKLSKSLGKPLNLEYVDEALDAVHDKINEIVYRGDIEYDTLTGLFTLSGVTAITASLVIDVAANNVFNVISDAYNDLPLAARQKSPEYSLVVDPNDEQYYNQIGNVTTNESWKTIIEKNLPVKLVVEANALTGLSLAGGGTIAAGTAWLVPKNKEFVRVPIAKSTKNVMDKNSVENDYEVELRGKTEARMGPVEAPYAAAVGKITGLRT